MLPPNAKLTRLVDAAVEPLSLTSARRFLRLETFDDDFLIQDLITAARLVCEELNDRSFITTTWKLTLDYFPAVAYPFSGYAARWGTWGCGGSIVGLDGGISLPSPPLIALQSMTYVDQSGATQSVDVSPGNTNIIVSDGTPGRIYPAYGTFFPISQPRPAAVDIVYTAGYGPDPSDVPKSIVQAIRMLTSFYYENRTMGGEPPDAVVNLLGCTWWGGYA